MQTTESIRQGSPEPGPGRVCACAMLVWQADSVGLETATVDDQITRALLYALIPVVVAFSFIVFVFYRARRESLIRQRDAEAGFRRLELELKALRAQMNPHFIFNCLNSIHHYIHRNDVSKASEYLIKFSRLIRHVLETSAYRTIPLADELDALRSYIELEQLRTDGSFTYHLQLHHDLKTDVLHVPPLLIQPFVENAIWHGLNNRGTGGRLEISVSLHDAMLQCVIDDNGTVDANRDAYDLSHTVNKTSMGMALIQGRIDAVNRLMGAAAGFTVEDKTGSEGGKRVTVRIPYEA